MDFSVMAAYDFRVVDGGEMRDSLPEELKEHEGALYRVVREGLDLFQRRHGGQRAGMTTRSERSLIHDCMAETAQKLFPSQCKRRGNLFLLVLDKYRIKLKKFDAQLITSSYGTQAVFDFLSQAVAKLFDFDAVNLQLGYIPTGLSVTDYPIWIAKPRATGKPEWEYELQSASVASLPALPVTNPNLPGVSKPRVTAKPAKFRRKDEKGERK